MKVVLDYFGDIVRLPHPHPWSGDSQGQETVLHPLYINL